MDAQQYLWSPMTVQGYATALAQWWSFLEQRGETERWTEVGVPAVAGVMSWLRIGRRLSTHWSSLRTVRQRLPGSPLAAVISYSRWHEVVSGSGRRAVDAWGTSP